MSGMSDLNTELKHAGDRAAYKAARRREAEVLLEMEAGGFTGRRLCDSAITSLGLTEKALRKAASLLDGRPSHLVDEIASELAGLHVRLQQINHDDKGE